MTTRDIVDLIALHSAGRAENLVTMIESGASMYGSTELVDALREDLDITSRNPAES